MPQPVQLYRDHFERLRQQGKRQEMKDTLIELVAKLNGSAHPAYTKEQHMELIGLAIEIGRELKMIPAGKQKAASVDSAGDGGNSISSPGTCS